MKIWRQIGWRKLPVRRVPDSEISTIRGKRMVKRKVVLYVTFMGNGVPGFRQLYRDPTLRHTDALYEDVSRNRMTFRWILYDFSRFFSFFFVG